MKNPILFLILLFSMPIAAQRINVQPSILDYQLTPGASEVRMVGITNLSDKKLLIKAYLADWLRDSTGAHHYYRPDTLSRSCASWVQLDKDLFDVPPNTTRQVQVRLSIPGDSSATKEMKWAMLFLQTVEEQEKPGNDQKQVKTEVKEWLRVGIHIYQSPPLLTKRSVKLQSFEKEPVDGKIFDLVIENTGDLMLQVKSYLSLTNIETGKEYLADKLECPVFPSGIRKLKLPVPDNIPKGTYSVLGIVDIGSSYPLQAMEKQINIEY